MRAAQSEAGISFAVLHFRAAVRTDLVRAARERAPELPAHETHDRRTLVGAVIARHDLEHLQVARCRREGADLGFDLSHIQILYNSCIVCQGAKLATRKRDE